MNLKLLISFFVIIIFSFPSFVFAHDLKIDGSIEALLHIDPNDDPIARVPSNLSFELKDKQNKFQPQNCICVVMIKEREKEIYSQTLFQNNNDSGLFTSTFSFVFPKKDVYMVTLTGKPRVADAFQLFTLTYTIQVIEQSPLAMVKNNILRLGHHFAHVIETGLVVLFFLGALIYQHFHPESKT